MKRTAVLIIVLLGFAPLSNAQNTWQVSKNKDEMTGEVRAFAYSPEGAPTRKMGFPYNDVKARLAFGCQGPNEWAYIRFSTTPNLSGGETKQSYDEHTMRVKWDEEIVNADFNHPWGDVAVHFDNGAEAIRRILKHGKVLVEVKWHGEGDIYFPVSLRGSTAAIESARQMCRK